MMAGVTDHIAHVLDGDGVAEVRFVRTAAGYTNAEEITLSPGATLDLGGGMTLTNPAGPLGFYVAGLDVDL